MCLQSSCRCLVISDRGPMQCDISSCSQSRACIHVIMSGRHAQHAVRYHLPAASNHTAEVTCCPYKLPEDSNVHGLIGMRSFAAAARSDITHNSKSTCGDGRGPSEIDQRLIALAGKVIAAQEPVLDVVERSAMRSICRPLALQLEHNHAAASASMVW